MNHYEYHSPEGRTLSTKDQETIDRVVPMHFKEFLAAMVHDDDAAAQLAVAMSMFADQ
jgi:hypothetical protein